LPIESDYIWRKSKFVISMNFTQGYSHTAYIDLAQKRTITHACAGYIIRYCHAHFMFTCL